MKAATLAAFVERIARGARDLGKHRFTLGFISAFVPFSISLLETDIPFHFYPLSNMFE